jgi:hypothetical protein
MADDDERKKFADKSAMLSNARDVRRAIKSARGQNDSEFVMMALGGHVELIWENLAYHIDAIDAATQVGKAITFEKGGALKIKVGASSITLKSDGTIDIQGTRITINGTSDVKIRGAKVSEN